MRHPQAFVLILIGIMATFGLLSWAGSVWGALGVLISGFALIFVISMAWLWSPQSGVGRGRRPGAGHDSFTGLH